MQRSGFLLGGLCLLLGSALLAGPTVAAETDSRPLVQMLVPGFEVYELPVDLPNLNNLSYRADGKLYALGYNGDIWLLSDTDGDSLEDQAVYFFDGQGSLRGPIGMAVIPHGHVLLKDDRDASDGAVPVDGRAEGVVVASKGKVSAIIDWDGDGTADEERVIADGWEEIPPNVDTIGVAIDAAGAIYFGLGTAAYNNAYLIDEQGQAHYDLASDRGTIQRIEPDLSRRSIVCTGVRFTIGLDFDEHGELFATDQEGATWLPNGNPFDELLHIPLTDSSAKPHFGFPPRHPVHLPSVIDEPSLFDYAPQHQSTCGLAFNLPRRFSLGSHDPASPPQTALFGPEEWQGDVFVTGESRGKLYRTELVRTSRGAYVARNQIIASLGMLTVDCCVSPHGDLLVCCHSGDPDWGTGPTGHGKLFAIRYADRDAPQPTAVWTAGPQEVRVAFDRSIEPFQLRDVTEGIAITYGEYVSAGDRFESLRPGYEVVQRQQGASRRELSVQGVGVTADRRTLVLSSEPHREAVSYALTLPWPRSDPPLKTEATIVATQRTTTRPEPRAQPLDAQPQIDLAYSLQGVLAVWEAKDPTLPGWSGVLPHLDDSVCRALAPEDAETSRLDELVGQPGVLTLTTQVDLRHLLHPAVQPGSRLDYEWPEEFIGLRLKAPRGESVVWSVGDQAEQDSAGPDGWMHARIPAPQPDGELLSMRLRIQTGAPGAGDASAILGVSIGWVHPDDESRLRELPLNRFLLPWANLRATPESSLERREVPELAGGSWGRGRQVFFSEEAACSKCHVVHGRGGAIGPDLSNLVHRDYRSVLRDVAQPSSTINPDYLGSVVALASGHVLTGTVRTDGERLLIGDRDGNVHSVLATDVDEMRHAPVSIMPDGLAPKLGPERMRDLLTFLLTEPPHMPRDSGMPPPLLRTRAEVAQALGQSGPADGDSPRATGDDAPSPLRILLVAGEKDHGPGEHDYPKWLEVWSELLGGAVGVTVDTAMNWPTAEQLSAADTIVFYQKGTWNEERAQAIDAHLSRGGGLVYIHWAIEGGPDAPALAKRIGLASDASRTKYRHGPLSLSFEPVGAGTGWNHPIAGNFRQVAFHDESYWQLRGDPAGLQVIATGVENEQSHPLFWSLEQADTTASQPGRVFVSILGHYSWTFDDPLFRILLLRGIAWTAHESVNRFEELATLGAMLSD